MPAKLDQTEKDLISELYTTRRHLGWSQERVAREFGVDVAYISRLENKIQKPSALMKGKIAVFVYENRQFVNMERQKIFGL